MSKGNLQSLFCGILFCISIIALIIACLAFTKGNGEYFKEKDVGAADTCATAAAVAANTALIRQNTGMASHIVTIDAALAAQKAAIGANTAQIAAFDTKYATIKNVCLTFGACGCGADPGDWCGF